MRYNNGDPSLENAVKEFLTWKHLGFLSKLNRHDWCFLILGAIFLANLIFTIHIGLEQAKRSTLVYGHDPVAALHLKQQKIYK